MIENRNDQKIAKRTTWQSNHIFSISLFYTFAGLSAYAAFCHSDIFSTPVANSADPKNITSFASKKRLSRPTEIRFCKCWYRIFWNKSRDYYS